MARTNIHSHLVGLRACWSIRRIICHSCILTHNSYTLATETELGSINTAQTSPPARRREGNTDNDAQEEGTQGTADALRCNKYCPSRQRNHPLRSYNLRVYFDIIIGSRPARRVTMDLRADMVPSTAENLCALCTGVYGIRTAADGAGNAPT